uniref:UDP-glycosyltransferase 1 n=1 Tax=Linum usitatissimum TaxID=4006 RepID=I2BHD6_LINUS|nr:UDP-glycosyltransferase 1 [Linum usitatissimum]
MFPWLAFGHILPFLQLAKLIAQRGHLISFISTPRNIDRLPKLPPALSSLITFVKLPLPSSDVQGLPHAAEATSDLEARHVGYLKRAYDLLQHQLSTFLQSSNPDFIICDYAPFWLPPIARRLGIPTVFFSIFIASVLAFTSPPADDEDEDYRKTVEDLTEKPRWVPFETTSGYYRPFEAKVSFEMAVVGGGGQEFPELHRFRQMLRGCDFVAVRTCPELEHDWLKLLEQIHKKPVFPIGVLPNPIKEEDEEGDEDTWKSIKEWLDDGKEKGSVVYVAFGSEAIPSQEELTEIATGLELSGLPFFWVLRSSDDPRRELPEGFEERTAGRGLVWKGWAPQVKILGHESVGCMFCHSGWSSVVEALQFGRPLVLLTFYADQGLNSKLLQEKGLGYLVPRNDDDGRFRRESVAESLRTVMLAEEGQSGHREKAAEMQTLFADTEKHESYVHDFLSSLVQALD